MGDFSHPNHVFCEATVALDNFEGKLRLKMKLSFPQLSTPISWKQPATCVCKINWDIGVEKGLERIGI
jgi:hypothetical protein